MNAGRYTPCPPLTEGSVLDTDYGRAAEIDFTWSEDCMFRVNLVPYLNAADFARDIIQPKQQR